MTRYFGEILVVDEFTIGKVGKGEAEGFFYVGRRALMEFR